MNLTTRMTTRFPEKLDFAAGEKICPHDGQLKVSRGEILLVNLLVQHVQLIVCWRITVSVNVRAIWNGYPGFLVAFPGYLERQKPFRAKLRVKMSLWKETLLILLSEFVGVQREFKGWLKNDCNAQISITLFSVSLLFFSWTKSYASIYFSLSTFFYFFLNPPAATYKIEEPHLPCFLHEAGCQCYYLRLLRWTQCIFFFLNLSASFNNTAFLSV